VFLLSLGLLVACAPVTAPSVGMANPASENCVAQGGTLEIRQGTDGEVGYCLFADGSQCEEWAFMRNECAPGESLATFTDPFAYCAAVGTIDAPDARYTGEQPPAAVIAGLRAALNAPADTPADLYQAGTFWRCAAGQVKACFIGANLPCEEKADLSETPNEGTVAFCKENPTAESVPAVATGRATVFAWRCVNGTPEQGDQVFQADDQGFIADFWYVLDPANATGTTTVTTTGILTNTVTDTVTVSTTGAYMPLPTDACQTIQTDAETALGVAFTAAEAPFFDYVNQEGGTGCQLTASGTGVEFSNPTAVIDALKAALVGWEEDPQYASGGPTGAGSGLTRDAALLLLLAEWTPDPAANCPDDQPIAACELTPEQQLYTVTVQGAMK
ncbi:MAG: DUF333 domain-containing protein, partial [Caldilineaceae bacterium]|nr:DUF333 domain-containing protein [Caldilineaceae bacterium]